ncbi:ESPR-type extended signal peptide-containing protein, partial [Acinetobacter nectaris]|uniref:ESPR-type extended signal peptide-containing protein n=1 Tax=Acinetobacter nectaris TaxID=1219382 RepID=UPI0023511B65
MNKIYKIVWNATLGTWVAVSELAKSKKKATKALVGSATAIAMITFSQGAFALGEGSGNGVSAAPKSTGDSTCPTATATYTADVALGCGATATSNNSAQGGNSATNSFGAVAIGSADNRGLANASYTINGTTYSTKTTTAAGTQTVALGSGVRALKGESTAIGNDSDAIGFASIAIGGDDIGSVSDATKTGYQSVTGNTLDTSSGQWGNGGLTGGYRTTASGDASMAIGMNARAAGDLSNAFGTQAQAMANSALALGTTAKAKNAGSTAVGVNSSASADKATALGANTQATVANGVALGSGSVASTDSGVKGYDPLNGTNSSQSSTAWQSNAAAVSVGNGSTLTRQITGLAAGQQDTDAVNVAQLKQSRTYTTNVANSLKNVLGSSANSTTDGTVTLSNIGGTGKSNINDAISSVNTAAAQAKSTVTNGKNIVVTSETSADGQGTTYTVKTADDLNVNSVKTGNSTLNNNGLSISGGPSVTTNGIDAKNTLVTGLSNGSISSGSTDAINGGQLYNTNTSIANVIGGNAKVGTDGTVTTSDIGGTGKSTVSDAVASVKSASANAQATADKGLNFKANNGAVDNVSLGETVTLADGKNTTATYDSSTNTYKYSVVDAPTFTGVVKANGFDANNQKIIDVANGTIGANSTDAVNGGQISNISNSTQSLIGGNAQVNTDGTVTTTNIGGTGASTVSDAVANVKSATANAQATADRGLNFSANDGTAKNLTLGDTLNVANGTNTTATFDTSTNTYKYSVVDAPTFTGIVKANGFDASNQKILNVGSGTIANNSTDAINGGQLYNTNTSIANVIGGNAKVGTDGTIATTNIGGTGQSTISDAVASVKSASANAQSTADRGLNFKANDGAVDNVSLGDTVTLADGTNTKATYDSSTNTYKYSVVDAPTFTGVVKANGFDANNQKIIDVANGTIGANSTDAVNGGQISTISNSTQSLIGGNAKVNTDGTVTTTDIGGTGKSNVSDAVASVKDQATKAKTTVTNGDNIIVAQNTNNDGSTNYTISAAKDLNVNSLKAGNTSVTTSGVTVDDGTNKNASTASQNVLSTSNGTNKNISQADSNTLTDGGNVYNISNASSNKITNGSSTNTTTADNNTIQSGANKNISTSTTNTLSDNFNSNTSTTSSNTITDGTYTTVTKAGGATYGSANSNNKASTVIGQNGLSFTDSSGNPTGPSVTASGINAGNQQVTNVASAGNIADANNAKNAVNASDLYTQVTNVTNSGLNFNGDTGTTVHRNLGQAVSLKGGVTDTTKLADANNVGVIANGSDSLQVKLAKDINLGSDGSLATGNSTLNNSGLKVNDGNGNISQVSATGTTVKDSNGNKSNYGATSTQYKDSTNNVLTTIGADGLSVSGGPSITKNGIDAASKQITNVASAVNDNDAVNKKELDTVAQAGSTKTNQLGTDTASALGGGAKYDSSTGTVSTPTYSVNGEKTTGVEGAIKALDQGFNVTSNGNNSKAVKSGDTLDIGTASGEKNLTVTKADDKITYALNRNLDVDSVKADSVKAGNSTLDTTGLTTTDSNGNSTQLTASGTSVQGKDSSGNAVSATYGAGQSALTSGTNTTTTTAAGTTVKNGDISSQLTANTLTVGSGSSPVTVDGSKGTVTGLTNTTWSDSSANNRSEA